MGFRCLCPLWAGISRKEYTPCSANQPTPFYLVYPQTVKCLSEKRSDINHHSFHSWDHASVVLRYAFSSWFISFIRQPSLVLAVLQIRPGILTLSKLCNAGIFPFSFPWSAWFLSGKAIQWPIHLINQGTYHSASSWTIFKLGIPTS